MKSLNSLQLRFRARGVLQHRDSNPASPLVRATRLATGMAAVLFLFCALDALLLQPAIVNGDGHEYLAYAHNIARGNGPYVKELPPGTAGIVVDSVSRLLSGEGVPAGTAIRSGGFLRDSSNRILSWHWWGYSAAVALPYAILDRVGAQTWLAFPLANLAFVLMFATYLARFSKQSAQFRALLALLFMVSGTTFYVWWTNPEVMSAALIAIGLVAWLDGRLTLSAFCLALASTQNPPVMVLVAFPVVQAAAEGFTSIRRGSTLVAGAISTLPTLAAGAVATIPGFWYFAHVGVPNPIVAAGAANFSDGILGKSAELFVGLDQGMILMQLGTFVLIGVAALEDRDTGIKRSAAAKGLALLLATWLMSLLAASAQNWNSGATVIARYAYWLSVPVIVTASMLVDRMMEAGRQGRALYFVAMVSIGLIVFWGFNGRGSSNLEFSPPSRWAMDHFRFVHFPHPEVFCERSQGNEGCDFDGPYVARNEDGEAVRVLVSRDNLLRLCDGQLPVEPSVSSEHFSGKTLLWYSGPVTCPSGVRIDRTPAAGGKESLASRLTAGAETRR